MKTKKLIIKSIWLLCLFLLTNFGFSQGEYEPSKDNLEAREWFQDAKFGLFIHWGVYSIMGGGGEEGIAEWIMQRKDIEVDAYEKLTRLFNPIEFNAKEWVAMAKDAGMKYITITSKHHDGFAMYDSQVSDYNIVEKTPFKRDILRELERECKKQGIKLFTYYSQLDWHHPDYFPRGRTGNKTGRPESGDWESYLQYQDAQIKEIAENYDISGFWFDGWWDQRIDKKEENTEPKTQIDWKLERTYKMIHDIKPYLLIGNNHHVAPFPGEDFQMFEKDLPGENTTGFGTPADDIGQLPLETCETINGSWGFNLIDDNHKSVDRLIKYIVNAAGRNTNFLLNVGPMPNGKIQTEHVKTLKEMGKWMRKYGQTVYGTRGGPLGVKDKYVTTAKGKTIYFHILDKDLKEISFNADFEVENIKRFDNGKEVTFSKSGDQISFKVPSMQEDIVTTVKMVLK